MKFTPLRITLIYLVFAIIWVSTTDQFIEWFVDDASLLTTLQTAKGTIFVLLTGLLLYLMTKSYEKFITQKNKEQKRKDTVFKNALHTSNVAIWEFHLQEANFVVSDNHNQLLGLPKESEPNMDNILANVHPKDRKSVKQTMESTITHGTDINIEFRTVHNDGAVRWLWSKGNTTFKEGKPYKIQGVLTDITESKELQSKLLREQELQTKILEHIPVMITVYNPTIYGFEVNREFEKITGWTNKSISDIDLMSEVYPDEEYRQEVADFMSNPNGTWKDVEMMTKNGDKIQTTWTNVKLSDDTQIGIGLDITDRKKNEKQLKNQRNELQNIYNSMPVMINIHDSNTGIAEVNKYFENRLGYSSEDAAKTDLLHEILYDKNDYESIKKHISNLDGSWRDIDLISKNGERISTSWTNVQISENKSIGIGIDITERKHLENEIREKEERLSLTTQSANVGLWEWNPQTGETKFDEIWANLVGYHLEELEPVSIETWNRLVHPDDLKRFEQAVEKYFSGENPIYECEIRMQHKDGHWVWILDRGQTVEWDEDGNPTLLVGTHVDITERVKFEEENRLLANVFLNSNTGLAVSNHKTNRLQRVNNAFNNLFGYTNDEMIGIDIESLYADDSKIDLRKLSEKLAKKKEVMYEAKLQRKDTSVFWGLINLVIVDDKYHEVTHRIATIQDITEIKLREDWIRKLTDNVPGAIFNYRLYKDGSDELTYMSSGCSEIWGVSNNEALQDISIIWDRIHPDDIEELRKSILRSKDDMERWDHSWRIIRGSNDIIWVNGFGQPEKMEDGSILWHSFIQDITLRKEQEEEIKRSRDRILQTQEIANLGYWTYNPKNKSINCSDIVYEIYNLEPTPNLTLKDYLKLTHPDDRKIVQQAFISGMNNNNFSLTHRIVKPQNQIGYVQLRGEKQYDEVLKTWVLNGTVLDITDLKTIEKELEEQQKKFEIVANITSDVTWEWNPHNNEVWWGEGIETVLGFSKEDYAGKSNFWQNHVHPEDKERVVKSMEKAKQSEKNTWSDEYRFIAADGSVREIEDRGMIIRDSNDNVDRIIGAMVDVTDQKEAERQLKASEEQYRLLFEQNPIPMFIYDPETFQFSAANNAAIEKYKYSRKEFLNLSILDIRPEKDIEAVIEQARQNRNIKETTFAEWTHITKVGKKLTVEISASHITYQGRKQRLVIANDITEQRLAEERAISAVVEGEDRERRRVAKELHDGLGQYLSAANMNLRSVYEDMPNQDDRFAKTFKTGLDLLHHAISETRTISQNLLPKAIQDYGLELATESLVNHLKSNNDIIFYLYQNIEGVNIPEKIQINLYRIMQESLNNAIRHGKPDNIDIQLVYSEDELLLVIEDNGVGFNPDDTENKGLGLRSIKTRVGAMSGNLDIVSSKGKGTIISVVVPI